MRKKAITKSITRAERLEYDISYAYSNLDEVFAIAQLLQNYIESEKELSLNTWTVRKSIEGLKSLIIEIQINLESSLDKK